MNNRGFTLLEVLIAMMIILIAAVGFSAYTAGAFAKRASMMRLNNANIMLMDVADRLSKQLKGNVFIQPKSGSSKPNVGYDADGNLKACAGGGTPISPITITSGGLTEYTNPVTSSGLFMYDNNVGIFSSSVSLNPSINSKIDHPNTTTDTTYVANINSTVNPIRTINGTTYYAVWSVAYMPCGTSTDKVLIFITVYWIEPEPTETSVDDVISKLSSGAYKFNSVSLSIDKAFEVEK